MSAPRVVFFDAVGTLFRVRDSVGDIYAREAVNFGVVADAQQVNAAFFEAFKSAPPAAFPNCQATQLPELEREWWRTVVDRTFEICQLRDRFSDFSSYFNLVFDCFATADTWELYDETHAVLGELRRQQVRLGVISNFDSRLYAVLDALNLRDYFETLTLSTQVGAAKPNLHVFESATQAVGVSPDLALHVGDSYKQDYLGAKRAGMKALWLLRPQPMLDEGRVDSPPATEVISDLTGIETQLQRDLAIA